jgi:hypothetical protein
MFQSALKSARRLVGTWEPGAHLFAGLDGLHVRHWEDPILRKILDGDEVDEKNGKIFLFLAFSSVILCALRRRFLAKSKVRHSTVCSSSVL